MTVIVPRRYALTSELVAHLVATLGTDVAVGRGTAPPEGGWPSGQPDVGAFVPYVVVRTGTARPQSPPTLGRARAIPRWSVGYRLATASARESTVDDVADLPRAAAVGWRGVVVTLGSQDWVVEQVTLDALGPTTPNRATDPPSWEVVDDISVWLTLRT